MKKQTLLKSTLCLLMALVCNVAWAQTATKPEAFLTVSDLDDSNISYPHALSDDQAALVFGKDVLTIAVEVTTASSMSVRGALVCAADPAKGANTVSPTPYIAVGLYKDFRYTYMTSPVDGQQYSSSRGVAVNNSTRYKLIYVLGNGDGYDICKIYKYENGTLTNVLNRGRDNNNESTTWIQGFKKTEASFPGSNLYIGGGVTSDGDRDVFTGLVHSVQFFDGVLTDDEIGLIEYPETEAMKALTDAVTANTSMNVYGLQRYLGLVQNAGTGLTGDGQISCNFPAETSQERDNAYANLLDGTYTTFFHSGYNTTRGDGSAHYLQFALNKFVKNFRFYFKKRSQNNDNRPKEILIEGSVDGNTFEEIETISDGMPSGAAPTDYYSDEITASKAYKYLRFTVKKTHSDQSSDNPFFTFSEFYILPNTPKVAETFDAMRGYRDGVTVANATKLNEVYAWHQGFTGNAYPNDLYEGVYTLTINGPAAATATYNGEGKALPATFYVTEEVAEENAAVTIASTESTLSFNCFSDETDTYETLKVTSLTENKVYTANFNYSLELKESTGRFTDGSKVWSLTTNDANPVALTFTSNANNMNHNGGYIQLHSGQAKSSTYTLTVPEGYIILEYSFDYAFGNTGTDDKKFVVGGQDYPVTAESQTLSVENVNATTTQFVLTGENQPVKVQNFIVTVKTLTAKEIIEAKKTALKAQVEGLRGQLGNQIGYYYCTIGGEKVYDADAILAAIDAASSAAAVDAIVEVVNAKTPILPEFGKTYKMAFKTKEGDLHHIVANDRTMALSVDADANNASVFYCMASNDANYPYIFVSAQGGFLTYKALSDAYINEVTDFKVGPMTGVTSNVNSSVESRIGTVYIATNKRPNIDKEDDGCFVFKNQDNTYDGADVPFHNDNFTSAIVMTEVAAESKTVYNIAVEGNDDAKANAYVAYDNGNVVRRAFNEGFFVTNGTITEAQLKAGFVGNAVKSATITMAGNAITLSDVVTFPTPVKQDLYNTSNGALGIPPHRIPGITVDPETGRIITTAARLVCGTDPGYGQVDVVCRISDDNGANWTDTVTVARGTGITSPTENYFDTAFGDPAVVADRTSNEVLIIVVAGCTKYQTASRAIPNMIGTIHSKDNGETWGEPVDVTEDIYSLFDAANGGNTIQSAFVGGGKIFQSRIVKVGKYYRLYAAMCARPDGNRVIYSDDFGRTWYPLGGPAALPATGGDEPKCEEMPDGRVILSSRVGGGRIYNIYTYSNTETAEGSWGTSVKSTFEGSGLTPGGNSTNGEILIVPVQRNSDQGEMYLALQSLPTGGDRSRVGIFYKELAELTDINSVANFAIDWNGFFLVTDKTSAYSSMDLQNDGRIGFIYEENYTKHGVVSNPHSIPFPDANNLGTHNYDGYDNIYVAYPLEIITNNAYSIKRDVNRRTYVSNYFTALTAEASDEMKAKMTDALDALSTEPTIAEVDKLNLIAAASKETEGTWYCFRMEEKRSGGSVPQNSWGYISDNLTATATPVKSGSYLWQKIDAGEGKFHLKSMNGKYLVPATTLTTSTTQPTAAWTFEGSATVGKDVIFNGDVPCQLHVYTNGNLANWGWNTSGTGARKDDDGCKFVFVEASTMTDVLDNLYEFDADAGKVGYYADATIDTYKSAIWSAMLPEQIAAAKTAVTSSTVWNMPVSGKAYTFKNVQKDGTTVCWFQYESGQLKLTTDDSKATAFVCRLLENGKYVFVCNDGKYLAWLGISGTGVRDAYDNNTYTDVEIRKMTTGGYIDADQTSTRYVNVYARRSASDIGCLIVQKSDLTFNNSNSPYWRNGYSSAIIMEEAAFGNAPKVNGVNEGELLSDDLHYKYMSTFSATYPTVAPEGVTAYYATKEGENVVLNAIAKGEAIPANTGVILVSEEGGNAVMLPAAGETAADVTDNLMGHSAGAPKDMSSVANAYILTGGAQGAGFYLCSGGTLAANKAYLVLPQQAGANAPAVRIRLAGTQGGTPTEVEGSELKAQGSQLIYDLQGRRVLNPTKGIYIVNGKKVVMK